MVGIQDQRHWANSLETRCQTISNPLAISYLSGFIQMAVTDIKDLRPLFPQKVRNMVIVHITMYVEDRLSLYVSGNFLQLVLLSFFVLFITLKYSTKSIPQLCQVKILLCVIMMLGKWYFVTKIVLVIEKNFWNSRLQAENLQNFQDRSDQFLASECFFNLFLEVSHI